MSNKSASRSPASSDRHSSQSPAYPSGQHSPPSAGNEAASNPSKISLSPASAYPNHPSALHPNHRSSSPQPVYVIQSSTSGHHEAELPRDQNHSFAQQPAHLAQIPFYPSHPAANIGYPGVLAQPPSLQCPYPPHPGIDIFYLDATRPSTQSYPQPEHSAYQRYPGHQQSFQVPQGPGSNFPSAHYQSQGMFSGSHNLSFSDNTFIDNSITSDNFMKEFLQHTIIGAEFDSSDRHPPPRCHPGTRLAIVERCKVFILECDGKEKMRWVVGPAGVGKSAIMQIVAEEIPADASVFFSVNGRQDGNKTFTTIAYQLAAKYEPYRQFIRNEISCDPSLFRKSLPAQFQKFIIDPFIHRRLFGPSHRLLIILDGLDECDDLVTQGELLELISEFCIAYPSSPIVWFVTSRPEPHITSFFDDDRVASVYTKEQVAINSDEACEDVQLYLRDELNKIKRAYPTLKHKREWPSELEFTKIATAAGGLFAYASTVIRYVGDRHYRNPVARFRHILETIAAIPKDDTLGRDHPMAQLDALYERILSSIPADVMINTRKLLLIYSNYGWDKEKFRSQCNRLALTEDAAYGAVSHLHAVVKVPTPDKADDECLTYFHKSFADFLFDFKRSGFCRNIAAEVAKIQAQSSLRIVEQVPDDFDGMASGERIKCSDYGYLKCGPGFCDNVSLSWPGDERFLITDSQLRLDLYRNSMRNVGNKFSLSSKRSWNMACFHLLTMRFVVSGVWFPFYKLQTSVFDKFRSELKELDKLKQVPLRMLDFAAVCGKIDLRFTSPIGMDGKNSDPWNPSCKHEKYDVELDGLRPSRGWSTSFSRFLDGPRVAHTDTPRSSIKAGKGSHWKSIGHGGDNHRCLYCSRRIAHHIIQNPDQLAIVFVDSTEMCYVELAFVDPDDGVSEWRYRFFHSGPLLCVG